MNLVEREISSVMDVKRLIAEIHIRPALWEVRCGEHKTRYCLPNLWKEVARNVGIDVTVEECKRKWKNLRDAYRAEVRRADRRMERDKLIGQYNPKNNYTSKWVYFIPMSFIYNSKRSRYTIDYTNTTVNDNNYDEGQDKEHDNDESHHYHEMFDIKVESEHHTSQDDLEYDIAHHAPKDNNDDDDETANDMLYHEFQNLATPQNARRVSETIHLDHNVTEQIQQIIKHTIQHDPPDTKATPSKCDNCNLSKSTDDDPVHFLEDLEKEEQKLIISTRNDIRRISKLDHVGDSDYNFLVSFLPQMKKMTELENLQFRSKMCDIVLTILAPSMSTNASLNPSPVPSSLIPWDSHNNTASLTYNPPTSTGDDINKNAENANNTATSTTFND